MLARTSLAVILGIVATPALAGDAEAGRALAIRWCQECHVVSDDLGGGDKGPPFAAIAANPEKTDAGLRAWLFTPHDPMPDLDLAPAQIDDLLAYIATLK